MNKQCKQSTQTKRHTHKYLKNGNEENKNVCIVGEILKLLPSRVNTQDGTNKVMFDRLNSWRILLERKTEAREMNLRIATWNADAFL